jgi:hypothetical protein
LFEQREPKRFNATTRMNRFCWLVLSLTTCAHAQILWYDLTGLSGTTAPAQSGNPATVTGISGTPITRGPGVYPSPLANGFSALRWQNPNSTNSPGSPSLADAIARGDFFEFSLTVDAGYVASLTGIEAWMRRSALNAPMNFQWQFSFDGFATSGTPIPVVGTTWTALGVTNTSFFQYLGRVSGTDPGNVQMYDWVLKDVPGRPNTTTSVGDPIPLIDLSGIAALQNVSGGTTITFRLYGWGNDSTVDSNTVALGRVNGPRISGFVTVIPEPSTVSLAALAGVFWGLTHFLRSREIRSRNIGF